MLFNGHGGCIFNLQKQIRNQHKKKIRDVLETHMPPCGNIEKDKTFHFRMSAVMVTNMGYLLVSNNHNN